MTNEILYDINLGFIFIGLIALFFMTTLACYQLGAKHRQSGKASLETVNEFLPSTILGLLALLLGFTFSMSISRFDTRKDLVMKEANAIGTTYLRSEIFPEGEAVRKLLKEYTSHRLLFFKGIRTKTEQYQKTSQALQSEIWKQTLSIAKSGSPPFAGLFMQSVNEFIDLDTERVFASKNHVPELVYFVIIAIAVFGLGSLSYVFGVRQQKTLAPFFLSILFPLVIVLIQDLDRPGRGLISVDQDVLSRLVKDMK